MRITLTGQALGPWRFMDYKNGWCVYRQLIGTAKKYCRTTEARKEYLNAQGKAVRQRYEFATVAEARAAIAIAEAIEAGDRGE